MPVIDAYPAQAAGAHTSDDPQQRCRDATDEQEEKMSRADKTVLLGLATIASLAISGCGSLSSNVVSTPEELDAVYTGQETLPQLVETIARPFVENGTNVGLVVGVLDGEDKWTFGFGKKSLASDETPDGDTIFAVGSVAKAFLSLVVHQLVQEGALSLSESLGDLLPEGVELSQAARKITIQQLMTHSSALPRQPNDFQMLFSLVNYTFTGENIYRHIDADRVFEVLRTFDPDPEEVGTYRYSNIGSAILGKLVELKTKKSLPTLLSERILFQLGANNTAYDLTAEQRSHVATGHVGDSPFLVMRNTPMAQWDMGNILTGTTGLYSTANDLLEFARHRISLGGGVVDITPIRQPMLSVSSKVAQKSSYGWLVDDFDAQSARIVFQHGRISGYSAYLGVDLERKIGVVVLANNFNWDDHIGHRLLLRLASLQTARREIKP
jgi:CubicO group peptidase (beta-lactamase class C family)